MNISDFIKDFEFIEGDSVPEITLDKNGRFYLSATARKLIPDSTPYSTLVIGYNAEHKALVVMPSKYAPTQARIATYRIDARHYMSARAFAKEYGFYGKRVVFRYERGMSDGSAFIFKLV